MNKIHPATYSKELIPVFKECLETYAPKGGILLDPMAGLGEKLGEIAGDSFSPLGFEIEQGYFDAGMVMTGWVRQGDATNLPLPDASIDAAVVSPPYPNGISDNFVANDASQRHTYIHRLRAYVGRNYALHPNNSGGYNPRRGGRSIQRFYDLHAKVWAEVFRVLKPRAPFIVNTKDTQTEDFTNKTLHQLEDVGFYFVGHVAVEVPGLNHGRGQDNKVQYEDVLVMRKPE